MEPIAIPREVDVDLLQTCVGLDEAHARQMAEKLRKLGDLDHAAILQRAADDLRHVRHDLGSGFAPQVERVEVLGALVAVGGES